MKNICIPLFISLMYFIIACAPNNTNSDNRYIEVTGSAEMEVEPDEIRFFIEIGEYWQEEFKENTQFKDYKTKVPIADIEKDLFGILEKFNISKNDITVHQAGNYYRYPGKDFLIKKALELTFKDFNTVDTILYNLNMKGIDAMRIGEIRNTDIQHYRQQVKSQALNAAKDKAVYMLESINKELGDVLTIEEINETPWYSQSAISNVALPSSESSGIDNIRKIKLRYEIRTRFEIEE